MSKGDVRQAVLKWFKKAALERLQEQFMDMKDALGDKCGEDITFKSVFGGDIETLEKTKSFWDVVMVLESNGATEEEEVDMLIKAILNALDEVADTEEGRLRALIEGLLVE